MAKNKCRTTEYTLIIIVILLFSFLGITPAKAQTPPTDGVVHAVLFWMDGCPYCHEVLDNVLPPLQKKYGSQLDILLIEVASMEDINRLYEVAAEFDISQNQVGVPFLIIGDHALVGSGEIPVELPRLIESFLAQGGVDWPSIPAWPVVTQSSPTSLPTTALPDPAHPSGSTLAILIMIGMILALLYVIVSLFRNKIFSLPVWSDWLIPVLLVLGIGVAGYLTYIETQSVTAICGPVGDCNTVQQSSYAKLFGVVPIGLLGLIGYFAMLTAWVTPRFLPKLKNTASIIYFGMACFAVIFSLYLTYLEPFVIKAVCAWCLTSAVIVTFLLLLATPKIFDQFVVINEAD